MITRDIGQLKVVHAVDYSTYDASCGSLNVATATANQTAGHVIDRLNLGRSYNSVLLHVGAVADIGTSTLDAKGALIGAWLYHASTTCASDLTRYSTDSEAAMQSLFVIGNTDTCAATAPSFTATATSTGSGSTGSGSISATSTDAAQGDFWARYSLAGANRYLRAYLIPVVFSSSSGGTVLKAYSDLVFGEADESPAQTTSTGKVFVTT